MFKVVDSKKQEVEALRRIILENKINNNFKLVRDSFEKLFELDPSALNDFSTSEDYIFVIICFNNSDLLMAFNKCSKEQFLKDAKVIWNRARALALSGEAKIAFLEFERALALEPALAEEPRFLWDLATVLMNLGSHQAAFDKLEMAVTYDPSLYNDAHFIWDRASALLNLDQTIVALMEFSKALAKDSSLINNAVFVWGIGIASMNNGDYQTACTAFILALNLDISLKKNANFLWDFALLLLNCHRPHQALAHFTRALEFNSSLNENAIFVWQRAITFIQLNEIPKAVTEFKRALDLNEGFRNNVSFMRTYQNLLDRYESQVVPANPTYATSLATNSAATVNGNDPLLRLFEAAMEDAIQSFEHLSMQPGTAAAQNKFNKVSF